MRVALALLALAVTIPIAGCLEPEMTPARFANAWDDSVTGVTVHLGADKLDVAGDRVGSSQVGREALVVLATVGPLQPLDAPRRVVQTDAHEADGVSVAFSRERPLLFPEGRGVLGVRFTEAHVLFVPTAYGDEGTALLCSDQACYVGELDASVDRLATLAAEAMVARGVVQTGGPRGP